jgi:hypothetical protein
LSPEDANTLIDSLKNLGAKEVAKSGYTGKWYQLPNGAGGFGIRGNVSEASKAKGSTMAIDLEIPGFKEIHNIKF